MHRSRSRLGRLLAAGILLMNGAACEPGASEEPSEQPARAGGWRTPGCEFSRSAQHVVVGGVRMLVTPAKLNAVIERIESGGRQRFAASYAGVEVDQDRVRAIVYRVPSEPFDDFVRHSAEDVCVVVRDAAHGVAELTEWHDRLVLDLPYWAEQGVQIVTVGSRHDGVGVEVGTRDVERARNLLPARYGAGAPLVFVEEGPVVPYPGGRPPAPPAGG